MVDTVVREVLDVVCRPQEAQNGLVWEAGERNLVFNANDGRIAGWDQKWVLDAMMVTVAISRRMGLENNLKNIRFVVCTPVFIWGKWSEQAYKQRRQGKERRLGRGRGCG